MVKTPGIYSLSNFQVCELYSIVNHTPDSSVHGILQEVILHWVTIPSSGNLPDSGIVPWSPALQADSLPSELPGSPVFYTTYIKFTPKFTLKSLDVFMCKIVIEF